MKRIKAFTVFLRVVLVLIAVGALLLALVYPLPSIAVLVACGLLFIYAPRLSKASFEAEWERQAAARAAGLEEYDDDDDDFDDDDDDDDENELRYQLSQKGEDYEKAGDMENAVRCYELALGELSDIPHPYLRLAVIYKKQRRWEDVVRVCDAAIVNLRGRAGKYCQPEEYEKRKAYALEKLAADRS